MGILIKINKTHNEIRCRSLIASVAATCEEGIKMEAFSDKDCKKPVEDEKKASHEVTKDELKVMNGKCAEMTDEGQLEYWKEQDFTAAGMKVSCDAKAISASVFDDKECKNEDSAKEWSQKWGECVKYTIGDNTMYIKYSGAAALQAAGAAALAFV